MLQSNLLDSYFSHFLVVVYGGAGIALASFYCVVGIAVVDVISLF